MPLTPPPRRPCARRERPQLERRGSDTRSVICAQGCLGGFSPLRRALQVALRLTPVLSLSACLLGQDPFKGTPNVPTLDGEPTLIEPAPDDEGTTWAREGTRVLVEISLISAIDLDATEVRLDDAVMACEQPDAAQPTYRCERVFDGTEANGPKGLAGTLAFRDGGATARLATAPMLTADFIPPTAACVLSPRVANASQPVTLVLTPSEPLRAPPTVSASDPSITASFRELVEGQYVFDITGEADANIHGYALTLTAEDRAGNPQQGSSLCDPQSRTGSLLGRGPALDGEPTLTANPSVDIGGVPTAREGATLTLTLPTHEPIDLDASTVTLSGIELDIAQPNTWIRHLDGTEGDGLKNLDATLLDAAGNALRVQVAGVVRFDFTPPAATCTLSPNPANGSQVVSFAFAPSEPLDGPPTLAAPGVTLSEPTFDGARWISTVTAPQGANTDFTIAVQATDRVGNHATDDDLCPEVDRTGSVMARLPQLDGEPTLTVLSGPHVPDGDATRVGRGALVALSFQTHSPIDTGASSVQLGDLPLAWDPTEQAWTRTITDPDPDGRKALAITLVDPVGNRTVIQRSDLAVRVDLTPPVADCVLSPQVANARDTEIYLTVFASEPLAALTPSTSAALHHHAESIDATTTRITLEPAEAGQDFSYVVNLAAEDLVGNSQQGDSLCPLGQRTGVVRGRTPTLVQGPDVASHEGAYRDGRLRVPDGATVEVQLSTDPPYVPEASFVSLSGIPMAWSGDRWVVEAATYMGEGPRALDALLVDDAGNDLRVIDLDLVFFDFSAPTLTTAGLDRVPVYGPARLPGTLYLTDTDPESGSPVSLSVDIVASEPVSSATLQLFGPSAPVIPPALLHDREVSWSFTELGAWADGQYQVAVVLTDDVGNTSPPLPLQDTLVLTRSTPAPTDTQTIGRVVLRVAPWGSAENPDPHLHLQGSPGSATPGARVRVDGLGEQPRYIDAGGDGSVALTIPYQAISHVQIAQLDRAGNVSPPAPVRDRLRVDRATPADASPGSPRFEVDPRWSPTLAPPPADVAEPRGSGAGTATLRTESTLAWTAIDDADALGRPAPRADHAAAFDPDTGRTLIFGGVCAETDDCDDVWATDLRSWMKVGSDARGRRHLHPVAYSPSMQTMLAWTAHGLEGWQDGSWSWINSGPPEDYGPHVTALDPTTNRLILRPGSTSSVDTPTWSWSADTGWRPVDGPPAKISSIFYDPQTSTVVGLHHAEELWESYTLTDAGWQLASISPTAYSTDLRGGRRAAALGGDVHVYGGCTGNFISTIRGDHHLWRLGVWSILYEAAAPGRRSHHSLSADAARARVVLFGGSQPPPPNTNQIGCFSENKTNDLWTYDGTTWSEVDIGESPSRRLGHRIASSTDGATLLAVGGTNDEELPTPPMRHGPSGWEGITQGDDPYPDASHGGLAYHLPSDAFVWFGGRTDEGVLGETWRLDEVGWTLLEPPSAPEPRAGHGMTTDARTEDVLLFGGETATDILGDLWVFHGDQWSQRQGPAPPARTDAVFVADPARMQVLLFGGRDHQGVRSDTWIWDGADWTEQTGLGPPGRAHAGAVFDPRRQTIVIHGGWDGSVRSDTWEWTGEAWRELGMVHPVARLDHALYVDPEPQAVIAWGAAAEAPQAEGARFSLTGEAARPAHRLRVMTQDAPPPSWVTVLRTTVRWRASGRGFEEPDLPVDGWTLYGRVDGAWLDLLDVFQDSAAPTQACWSVRANSLIPLEPSCEGYVQPDLGQRLLNESLGSTFAIRPIAANGPGTPAQGDGTASISTAWAEIRTWLRLTESL